MSQPLAAIFEAYGGAINRVGEADTAFPHRGDTRFCLQYYSEWSSSSSTNSKVAAVRALPPNYAPHAPTTNIKGKVISIYGGLARVGEAGTYSIVTINRGKAEGLEIGHVLALYSAGGVVRDISKGQADAGARIQLPDERSGLVFVFRVFDRVSYALVMNITRPVGLLDVVQTP